MENKAAKSGLFVSFAYLLQNQAFQMVILLLIAASIIFLVKDNGRRIYGLWLMFAFFVGFIFINLDSSYADTFDSVKENVGLDTGYQGAAFVFLLSLIVVLLVYLSYPFLARWRLRQSRRRLARTESDYVASRDDYRRASGQYWEDSVRYSKYKSKTKVSGKYSFKSKKPKDKTPFIRNKRKKSKNKKK